MSKPRELIFNVFEVGSEVIPFGEYEIGRYEFIEKSAADKLAEALEFYQCFENFCLYEDIDWTDNYVCERTHPQKLSKFGETAKQALAEYRGEK